MAKVTGPLMSYDARGSIAKAITYSAWRGISYVRQWFKPGNPNTTGQQNVRGIFTFAIDGWHYKITPTQQLAWIAAASGKPYSGFNYYVSEYCKAMAAGTTPPVSPPGT